MFTVQEGRQFREDEALGLPAERVVDPAVLVALLRDPPVVGRDGRREHIAGLLDSPAPVQCHGEDEAGAGPSVRGASPRVSAIARSSRPWRYSARP